MQIPLLNLSSVYHIGTLNKRQKNSFRETSLEGEGLSVSLCPTAWGEIAEISGTTFKLNYKNSLYIDFLYMMKDAKAEIIDWAIDNGYAEEKSIWKVWSYDDESEEWRYMELNSYDDALSELNINLEDNIEDQLSELNDEYNAKESPEKTLLSQAKSIRVTLKGREIYSGFSDLSQQTDMVVIIWLKEVLQHENPDVIGLWWNENYDPENLSAPRGVILPECVEKFKISKVKSLPDDENLLDSMPEPFNFELCGNIPTP